MNRLVILSEFYQYRTDFLQRFDACCGLYRMIFLPTLGSFCDSTIKALVYVYFLFCMEMLD